MKIADLVKQNIEPLFEHEKIKLVDVEYQKLHDGMHLIVYIDKEGGVTVDDCASISLVIDPVIEKLNPTNDEPYYFDVMSYGLDKPLKFDWQFEKYKNKKVCVKLYAKINGEKDFVAELVDFDNDSITINKDNKILKLEKKQIAQITPNIEF